MCHHQTKQFNNTKQNLFLFIISPTFPDMFGHKIITLICFDTSTVPFTLLPYQQPILLSTLFPRTTSPIPFSQPYDLQTLYSTIYTLRFPSTWGEVDTSQISYRLGTNPDAQHLALTDDAAFHRFWGALINKSQKKDEEEEEGEGSNLSVGMNIEAETNLNEQDEVQLIVYRKRHTEGVWALFLIFHLKIRFVICINKEGRFSLEMQCRVRCYVVYAG